MQYSLELYGEFQILIEIAGFAAEEVYAASVGSIFFYSDLHLY